MTLHRRPRRDYRISEDGRLKLAALIVVAAVAIVAIVMTHSAASVGMAVAPLVGGLAMWFNKQHDADDPNQDGGDGDA